MAYDTLGNIEIVGTNPLRIYDRSMRTTYEETDKPLVAEFWSREDMKESPDPSLYKFSREEMSGLNLIYFFAYDWDREFVNKLYSTEKRKGMRMKKDKQGNIIPNRIGLSRKLFERRFGKNG